MKRVGALLCAIACGIVPPIMGAAFAINPKPYGLTGLVLFAAVNAYTCWRYFRIESEEDAKWRREVEANREWLRQFDEAWRASALERIGETQRMIDNARKP